MKKVIFIVIITFVIILSLFASTHAFTITNIYGKHGREGWIITNEGTGYETFDVYDRYGNRVGYGRTNYLGESDWFDDIMDDMKLDMD